MIEFIEEVPRVDKYTRYKAADGTVFTTAGECQKYEETAKCVIRGKLQKCITKKDIDAWDLMGGYEDNSVTSFKLSTKSDVDSFMQLLCLESPYYLRENGKERYEQIKEIVEDAFTNGDVLLVGQNCDGDYYFINSRQNIINNLKSLDKSEEEEK